MSNHLAIAGTTATLVQLLDAAVQRDFDGARATAGRPDIPGAGEADPEVRVFLYRVEPSGARGNEDLPTRGPDAHLVQRPQLALALDYLLTFIGNDTDHAPQRLLGTCAGTLHFHPILTREEIEKMVQSESGGPLAAVDLAAQDSLVRITPLRQTAEELATLWSSFFQVEYRLSVAYRAEVVLLTPPETPARPLPVRERRLHASTMLRPAVNRVVPDDGELAPILPGSVLHLEGVDLRGEETTLALFGDVTAAPTRATGSRIEVTVPDDVPAGAVGLVVQHRRRMGEPPTSRPAGQSGVVAIVIHPRIRATASGHEVEVEGDVEVPTGIHAGTLVIGVAPPVGSKQTVSVLLNSVGGGPAFSFFDERRDGPTDPPATDELRIAYAGVPAGTYLVRVVVGGAESPLESDPADGTFVAPEVVIP